MGNIQKEMVVVYHKGDFRRMHELQYQLLGSFEGRALSVKRVTSNKGGTTAGVDRLLWLTPHAKFQAIHELKEVVHTANSSYQANNIKRVWISKPNSTELRPLGIPTILDRTAQMLVLLAFDPIIEEISDRYSYGARLHRSPHDALLRLRQIINKPTSPKWVWDVDISKCFDNISHEFIESKIDPILCNTGKTLIKKWIKAGIVEKGAITYPSAGTPQGGVISPLLCNMTLNGIDELIRPDYPRIGTKMYKQLSGCWSIRFVDDIVMTSPNEIKIRNEYQPMLKEFLEVRGLQISNDKSKIINLEEDALEYLGWNLQFHRRLGKNLPSKNKSVLIIKPTTKAIKRVKLSMKLTFKSNMPLAGIINKQNPIIRGWTNYYRVSFHSQAVFAHLSKYQYILWWRWALRTHPLKSKTWIVNKYIYNNSRLKWQIGISKTSVLLNPVTVTSIKTAAMKTNLNPYVQKDYFVKRFKILDVEKFRKSVYVKHKYRCAACGEILGHDEPIELHHIIPKKDGGKYNLRNIVPLHRTCHLSVTYTTKSKWIRHLRKP